MSPDFWNGRRVLVTGHTGFKGSWLSLWLQHLGANVAGYALAPSTHPDLFGLAGIERGMASTYADVRDLPALRAAIDSFRPEIVFHLAAQALVGQSYDEPVETYATNMMGTVHLLEAVRQCGNVRAVVVVTSDKCYENREWDWSYRENEQLGGHDPYSNSKACAELVTAAYRNSYFPATEARTAIATVRAGNVVGGGDWARNRLVPDVVRSICDGRTVVIRNPAAIRPWQHVLEPLSGYLSVAQRLVEEGHDYADAWNFGPSDEDCRSVSWVVARLLQEWGSNVRSEVAPGTQHHEARCLKLDSSKAKARLGWAPRWNLVMALIAVVNWHKAHSANGDMRAMMLSQIEDYSSTPPRGTASQ